MGSSVGPARQSSRSMPGSTRRTRARRCASSWSSVFRSERATCAIRGGYVVTPATREDVSARFPHATRLDFAVPAAVVRDWQGWSRLEILVFGALCVHKEARRRGIHIAARVTSAWLAAFLKQPARSCRQALRELARRGVIQREEGHRWAPTSWAELACAGHPTGRLATSSRLATAEFTSGSNGKQPPELAAIVPPGARQRRPCAHGGVGPDQWGITANVPPGSSGVRTLSTRGRDLPPRDPPPPSLHPEVGREGEKHFGERHDSTAALVPLARAAVKAFRDRNAVVDVNHAVRRLAEAKARYGMTSAELEQYVGAAPDQPGLFLRGVSVRCRLLTDSCRTMARRTSPPASISAGAHRTIEDFRAFTRRIGDPWAGVSQHARACALSGAASRCLTNSRRAALLRTP